MGGGDSTMDAKTFITQLKGYLLDQNGVPEGFNSLSPYDALALYFSMIRNDFKDVLRERSQVKSVLQYVYDTRKGGMIGDKALQSLVGYEMIYGNWSQAETLCEQALTDLSKDAHSDMLATLISLELKLGKFAEAQGHFDDYASAYPGEETTILILKESCATAEADYEYGWKHGLNKSVASSPRVNAGFEAMPEGFELIQNFPNPFNPETAIQFSLPGKGHVQLRIYDVLGVEVRALVNENKEAGRHRILWDGNDKAGNAAASGVYLYRMTFVPEENGVPFTRTAKMSLLR